MAPLPDLRHRPMFMHRSAAARAPATVVRPLPRSRADDLEGEPGAQGLHGKQRRVPQVVRHRRGVHDLAGVEHVVRVEELLDLPHRLVQRVAEDLPVELAACQSVAVLAGVDAAVLGDEILDLHRDAAHLDHVRRVGEVEIRPDVQTADRAVPVEAGRHPVPVEDFLEPAGVLGEMDGIDGGVLDEGQRAPGALAGRHQQPEPRLADLQQGRLLGRGDRPQGVIAVPVPGPQRREPLQLPQQLVLVVTAEGDEEQRLGISVQQLAECRVLDLAAGQIEDRPVHQLHGGRVAGQRVLGRVDGSGHRGEVADGDDRTARLGHQIDQRAGRDGQRPLRTDDEFGQVEHGVLARQPVQPVAAGPAPVGGKPSAMAVALARTISGNSR